MNRTLHYEQLPSLLAKLNTLALTATYEEEKHRIAYINPKTDRTFYLRLPIQCPYSPDMEALDDEFPHNYVLLLSKPRVPHWLIVKVMKLSSTKL